MKIKDTNAASHQEHYGTLDKAVVETGFSCYVEHGIVDYMQLDTGKAIAGEGGIIYLMQAKSETAAAEEDGGVIIIPPTAKIEIKEKDLNNDNTDDSSIIASLKALGYTFSGSVSSPTINQPATIANKIAENQGLLGSGTEEDPFQIYDKASMQAITMMYDSGYNYFKIVIENTYNGEIDCTGWAPIYLNGSFDGNGVKFTNVTACLFQNVGYKLNNDNITLKNFSATMNVSANQQYGAAGLIKNIFNAGTTTFENINVSGKIEGYWNVGSFYCYGTANYNDVGCDYTVNFKNCKSSATLICSSGNTCGGFLGHGYEGAGHTQTLNVDSNSKYTGTIYTTGGNGGHYIAMNSTGRLIFNGVETSRYDSAFTSYAKNSKITAVAPKKGTNGYTVETSGIASKYVVSVTAQLDAYDDNNQKISNLSGITMVLGSTIFESPTSDTAIFGAFTSVVINNNRDGYDYSINDGTLTINIGSDARYETGTIRLQVAQYDASGNIVSCGTLDLANRASNDSGKLADAPATWTVK